VHVRAGEVLEQMVPERLGRTTRFAPSFVVALPDNDE
jgi:hypothetical protein